MGDMSWILAYRNNRQSPLPRSQTRNIWVLANRHINSKKGSSSPPQDGFNLIATIHWRSHLFCLPSYGQIPICFLFELILPQTALYWCSRITTIATASGWLRGTISIFVFVERASNPIVSEVMRLAMSSSQLEMNGKRKPYILLYT